MPHATLKMLAPGSSKKAIEFNGVDDTDTPVSKLFSTISNIQDSGFPDQNEVEQIASYEALSNTTPFPFEEFPLSVRNHIYTYLLVIPALICVRQRHTASHKSDTAHLTTVQHQLLPNIARATIQLVVAGFQFPFWQFRFTNTNILLASKKIHAEARAVLYGANGFEIKCPSFEFNPPTNFKIPLFPVGCQGLVRKLNIRCRAFYPVQWLLHSGYNDIEQAYPCLDMLTLIFELETTRKGFGKLACRREGETWKPYVKRLHSLLATQFLACGASVKTLPAWINLRVLFDGDRYDEVLDINDGGVIGFMGITPGLPVTPASERAHEDVLRMSIKRGVAEAFELFK